MKSPPELRIQTCNQAAIHPQGEFVLYWMIANRRGVWNFSLDRALQWARELKKPLVVLEALRCDYPWASERLHAFVINGMRDNQKAFKDSPVFYYPYLEDRKGAGKGLLQALAQRACVVVTDEFPCFFLPQMVAAAAKKIKVKLEAIDANGLLPLRATDRVFPTAYAFRRFLQKTLPEYLIEMPQAAPLRRAAIPALKKMPQEITQRWPMATLDDIDLTALPIDHGVKAVDDMPGGAQAAQKTWKTFLKSKLKLYAEHRSEPVSDAASGLSPYLHFGHISVHQIFHELAKHEAWKPEHLARRSKGSKQGWWGMGKSAEAFLDEVITWREVGFNMTSKCRDYDRYESLPAWAQRTLERHAKDARPHRYDLKKLEAAQTYDPLWNAAQKQLVREGTIQNYLRMLWGKKILEWSASPQEALEIMIELNNKYALDGRNPNSYSGIFWCLGRYDRPWGPERPIFGLIRYMSSDNTARKFKVKGYLSRFSQ